MKTRWIAVLALTIAGGAAAHDGEGGKPHSHGWLEMGGADLDWSAGLTLTSHSFNDWSFAAHSFGNDGSFTASGEDRSDVGYRVHAGLDFLEHFGVELGYADFGEASFDAQSDGSGTFWNAGPVTESMTAEAYDVTLIGRLNLGVDTAIAGRIGMLFWEAEGAIAGSAQCCGPLDFASPDDGADLQVGVAAEYEGVKPLRFVLGYSRVQMDVATVATGQEVTLSSFWASVAYLF